MEQASETLPPAAELKPPDQDDRLAEQPGSRPPEVIPDAQSPGSPDTTQPELAKAPVQQAAGGVEVQKSTSSNQAAPVYQPAPTSVVNAPGAERMSAINFGLIAFGVSCLLASMILYFGGALRRTKRTPIQDLNPREGLRRLRRRSTMGPNRPEDQDHRPNGDEERAPPPPAWRREAA